MSCIPPNPRRVGYIDPIHGPLEGPLYMVSNNWIPVAIKNNKNAFKWLIWNYKHMWYGDALVVECAREKQTKEQIEKMNRWGSETLDVDCPCRRRQGAPGRPRNRPSPGFYSFDENLLDTN